MVDLQCAQNLMVDSLDAQNLMVDSQSDKSANTPVLSAKKFNGRFAGCSKKEDEGVVDEGDSVDPQYDAPGVSDGHNGTIPQAKRARLSEEPAPRPQDHLPDTPPYIIKGHTCCIGGVKCGLFTVRRCYNVAGSVNNRRDVIGHAKGGEGSGGGEGGLVDVHCWGWSRVVVRALFSCPYPCHSKLSILCSKRMAVTMQATAATLMLTPTAKLLMLMVQNQAKELARLRR